MCHSYKSRHTLFGGAQRHPLLYDNTILPLGLSTLLYIVTRPVSHSLWPYELLLKSGLWNLYSTSECFFFFYIYHFVNRLCLILCFPPTCLVCSFSLQALHYICIFWWIKCQQYRTVDNFYLRTYMTVDHTAATHPSQPFHPYISFGLSPYQLREREGLKVGAYLYPVAPPLCSGHWEWVNIKAPLLTSTRQQSDDTRTESVPLPYPVSTCEKWMDKRF